METNEQKYYPKNDATRTIHIKYFAKETLPILVETFRVGFSFAALFSSICIIITISYIYAYGVESLLHVEKLTIDRLILNSLYASTAIYLIYLIILKINNAITYREMGYYASGGAVPGDVFSRGRTMSDNEARKLLSIPSLEEKSNIDMAIEKIVNLEGTSHIHDKMILSALNLSDRCSVTSSVDEVRKIMNKRFGGSDSGLSWKIDEWFDSENSTTTCELKVCSDEEEGAYYTVESGTAKYPPVAAMITILRREARMWYTPREQ